jgi:HSP20 family protein
MTTKRKSEHKKTDRTPNDIGGGIFNSLTGFLENLGDLAASGERFSRQKSSSARTEDNGHAAGDKAPGENRFGRILSGLTNIAEKLSEISENGEGLTKKGEFTYPSKEGGVKGVYGFSLKMGMGGGDEKIRVEPFGNIRKDKETGEATVQEIHEPLVDVFEEKDATTLVVEMPGVGQGDIKIEARDDVLTVHAEKGEKKYRKEILLHHPVSAEKTHIACNNGIVTIRCEKA